MIKRLPLIIISLALCCFVIVACSPRPKNNNNGAGTDRSRAKPAYKSAGDEGTITGKINFTGTPPTPRKLDLAREPQCASKNPGAVAEDVVVSDGKLANVLVYLKGGPADKHSFETVETEVSLDQSGCQYAPHVISLQANQPLKIVNSDPVSHNIHPTPKSNQEWNESQAPGSAPKEKKFTRPEELFPVKCDIHPWMRAYIGVFGHWMHAVSGKDGSYTIKNAPPGEYTLVAYHEKYGEKTEKISVPAKGSAAKDFTYDAAAAYVPPTSLRLQPALVLPY